MKMIHDGKVVLAVQEGEAIYTDLTVFEGEPSACRDEKARLGLAAGLPIEQQLAVTDDDRLAYGLLRQKQAINTRLVALKVSQKVVDASAAVVPPVLEAKEEAEEKPEEPGKDEPIVEEKP